jgi:hypothetical protein
MEEEGFIYGEKRSCKICVLFTKFMFVIFHFVSLCICFEYIEKRNIAYYSATIVSIFMCIWVFKKLSEGISVIYEMEPKS